MKWFVIYELYAFSQGPYKFSEEATQVNKVQF